MELQPASVDPENVASNGWHSPTTYAALLAELRDQTGVSPPMSLVSFTIAGVQQFLEAARTTRDVWNGSYLLSYLAYKATSAMFDVIATRTGHPRADVFRCALIPDVSSQPFIVREATGTTPDDITIASFPNSILLLAPGSRDRTAEIALAGEAAVRTTWNAIVNACEANSGFGKYLTPESFARQEWQYQTRLDRVLEMYWSVVEVPVDEAAFDRLCETRQLAANSTNGDSKPNLYGALIDWSGRVLGSRKRLRDFEQIGEDGHRCSLCGARSALADYEMPKQDRRDRQKFRREFKVAPSYGRLRAYWERVRSDPGQLRYRFRRGDRLCAVCVVRRLAPYAYFPTQKIEHVEFPSTSSLATAQAVADLLRRTEQDAAVEPALKRFGERIAALRKALADTTSVPMLPYYHRYTTAIRHIRHVDGDWLYPEAYGPDHLAREYAITEERAATVLADERRAADSGLTPLDELRRALHEHAPDLDFEPSNYYALIVVDGDQMGEWIAGRKAHDAFGPTMQRALSTRLASFARVVRREFERSMPGKIVYAGGDDLLAFVPRERALDALQLIDDLFRTELVGIHRTDGKQIQMTVSMACVLARHNDPLSLAIERGHALLKDVAKREYGRNAFVIYRTTGGRAEVGTRVRQSRTAEDGSTEQYELLAAMKTLQAQMQKRIAPPRVVGLSGRVVSNLDEFSDALRLCPDEARASIVEHVSGRQFQPEGDSDEVRAANAHSFQREMACFYAGLTAWLDPNNRDNHRNQPHVGDPYAYDIAVRLLESVRFLTREGR